MRILTSNPVYRSALHDEASATPVTYGAVAFRTMFLVAVTVVVGILGIVYFGYYPTWFFYAAMPVAFVSVLLGIFVPKAAPFFATLYAAAEGLLLGIVSFLFESVYQGIVLTAIATTVITLAVMMILFSMNLIHVGIEFSSFLVVALIATIIMSIILVFTGSETLYYIVCIFSAILATLYLFLDFANIRSAVERGADRSVAWTLSLGLMVSLVWLYVEILRLLAIFAGRRR
jgi:uncharacterized YccA/Bax inhibitor family protein